jgi:hypothetical protein
MCAPETATETAHLVVDGPVTLVVELAHALEKAVAAAAVRTTIRRRGKTVARRPAGPLRMLATRCLSGCNDTHGITSTISERLLQYK